MLKIILAFILGATPGIIRAIRIKNRSKKRKGRKRKERPTEFKKMLVGSVLATYFLGVALGGYIVLKYDSSQLAALLTYIGAPTTGAILSYCYVIRTENAIKLKRLYPQETEGYSVDINNTSV